MNHEGWQRYLAWDTSSVNGLVSAFEVRGSELREVVSWSLSLETSRHSERLLWSIDTVLQSAGWTLQDLSGFAIGVGPGSFTGLRIGITTARILAASLKIPVISLSSLRILARNAWSSLPDPKNTLVIACTDATKGEWFTLMGTAESLSEGNPPELEAALPAELIFAQARVSLANLGGSARWIAIGQSVLRYENEWLNLPQETRIQVKSKALHVPTSGSLTQLAFEAIQKGEWKDSSQLAPRYLRDSEAEVKLRLGLLKPSPTLLA